MTKHLLAISLLPLLMQGCGPTDNNDPNVGDADADTDTDTDSDTNFAGSIVLATPFEGVHVTVDGIDAECSGTSCTFAVEEPGEYQVQAWDTYTFISKVVVVTEPGEYLENWETGGCLSDTDWDGTTECDSWEAGEYGMVTFEGERDCVDEIWGREEEIKFVVDEAITIVGISTLHDGNMSGNNFYGSDQERGTWFAGKITQEGAFHVYMWNNSEVTEYLYYCD